jgi:putative flippase GtrA
MREALHQLVRFLLGSALGLTVDLAVFATGVGLGAPPWLANTISAGCAVVVVYLFVTKYAFRGGRSRAGFLLFVGWYVVSIVLFSGFIELLHAQTGWAPFICKLVSLPPSFGANFVVSRVLLHRRSTEGPVAADSGSPPARNATRA